jgi:DNA-binding MarR family transcriptional regulator
MARDAVDLFAEQWRTERPDLDVGPMTVVGRISRASRLLERGIRVTFDNRGLQPWEFDMLASLRRAGPPYRLTAGQLVTAMMVSPASITSRADALVARGLVTRALDPDNRRSVLIGLTEAGDAILDEAVEAHLAREDALLESLTARERDQLARLLRKLLLGLGDDAPE